MNQDLLTEGVQFSGKFESLKALSFGFMSCSTAASQAHHPLRAEQHLTEQQPFKYHTVPYTHPKNVMQIHSCISPRTTGSFFYHLG